MQGELSLLKTLATIFRHRLIINRSCPDKVAKEDSRVLASTFYDSLFAMLARHSAGSSRHDRAVGSGRIAVRLRFRHTPLSPDWSFQAGS